MTDYIYVCMCKRPLSKQPFRYIYIYIRPLAKQPFMYEGRFMSMWICFLGTCRWDLFQYRGELLENMEIESALKTGMKTWARWIDSNTDPNRTTVFFRSISPTHNDKQNCSKATQPLMDESYTDYFPEQVIQIIRKGSKG